MPGPYQWSPPAFGAPGAGGPQQPPSPMMPQQAGPPQPQAPGPAAPPPAAGPAGGEQGTDPEVIQKLADLWGIPYEQAALALAQKRAEMLAGTPSPQGRQVGGVYTAGNPLEFAGAGARQALGMRQMMQNEDQLRKLGQRDVGDRQTAAMDLMRQKGMLSF